MKKIVPLVLMLMLMASTVSLAFADKAGDDHHEKTWNHNTSESENETNETEPQHIHVDDETAHELEIMNTTLGAQIRLLQLEKSLITNILKGVMTVQVLKELGVNTTDLMAILGKLRGVLLEVRATDPSANDSVQIFIELKNKSRAFTKEFRDTLHGLLTNETLRNLREQLRNLSSDELQNCSQKLQSHIRHFNRNQLYRLYGIIGETNTSLITQYLNGTVNLSLIKLQLHKLINQMTKEKREVIFSDVKEENIKRKIRSHNDIDEYEHHGKGDNHGRQHQGNP